MKKLYKTKPSNFDNKIYKDFYLNKNKITIFCYLDFSYYYYNIRDYMEVYFFEEIQFRCLGIKYNSMYNYDVEYYENKNIMFYLFKSSEFVNMLSKKIL